MTFSRYHPRPPVRFRFKVRTELENRGGMRRDPKTTRPFAALSFSA
jgi:hypothetical protein